MKFTSIILSTLIFLSCQNNPSNTSQASEKPSSTSNITNESNTASNVQKPQTVEDKIKHIRSIFESINNDKSLQKKDFKWENDYSENCGFFVGEVTRFTNAEGLRKVIMKIGGDGSTITQEYYYDKGQLFFVYSVLKYYPPMPDAEAIIVNDYRIYIEDGKIIRTLSNSKEVDGYTEEHNVEFYLKQGNQLITAQSIKEFDTIICYN